MAEPPLIVHIVHRLDYGGLENGVVNVTNGLCGETFRHAIVALTESTEFSERLSPRVMLYTLGKRPGKDLGAYWRLFKWLRRQKPNIVHTRNIGTLDCSLVAFLAGVPVRIHGEHGWDVFDQDGMNPRYRRIRRFFSRFVHVYVAVSMDLSRWITTVIGVPAGRVTRICNGVDTDKFRPASAGESRPLPADIFQRDSVVIGSVTRFSAIKDPLNLIEAFIRLRTLPEGRNLRLLMVGDGELRPHALVRLHDAGVADSAWLPGSRDDVPDLLRAMHVFVLASLREGISNTLLEAMACGLPTIATDTGGNPELVVARETGALVPPGDSRALARAIAGYAASAELRASHGRAARARAVQGFSIAAMLAQYRGLYERHLVPRKA